jgi:hypothetical protein
VKVKKVTPVSRFFKSFPEIILNFNCSKGFKNLKILYAFFFDDDLQGCCFIPTEGEMELFYLENKR